MIITLTAEEYARIVMERDELRDRIKQMEFAPLKFTLQKLAHDIERDILSQCGCTPEQRRKISDALRLYAT